jgi:hypothetical protein
MHRMRNRPISHRVSAFPIRALRLTGLLVGGLLVTPAQAHPDSALHPALDTTTPARVASVDLPVVSPVLTGTAREAGYVDPAGGHARVRPIETQNPYRGHPSGR